jgi:hypothetical protein
MENLKVNDWVNYQGKKRQIAIVNEDGTVRLKSDDPTEKYYDNGTIGCFSQSMFVDKQKTAVEWVIDELFTKSDIEVTKENNPKLFSLIKQALEMEKQQIIEAYACGVLNECSGTNVRSDEYYNQTYKSK